MVQMWVTVNDVIKIDTTRGQNQRRRTTDPEAAFDGLHVLRQALLLQHDLLLVAHPLLEAVALAAEAVEADGVIQVVVTLLRQRAESIVRRL